MNENAWILIKSSLQFVPNAPIYTIPALVQIMAWHRPGDEPLSEPITVRSSMHICITGLTHWGRVRHICVGNLTIIGSDNGLSPGRRQAITWTNVHILLIGPIGTNFSEVLIEIHTFSSKQIHLKISSGKWRPFCLGLNVLSQWCLGCWIPLKLLFCKLFHSDLLLWKDKCKLWVRSRQSSAN